LACWRVFNIFYYSYNPGGNVFFGIVLIIIGAILLLKQMGIIHHWTFWGYLWPVLIIAVGVQMLLGRKNKRHS
jgi:hypothetical protein